MAYEKQHLGMLIEVLPDDAFRRIVEALKVHDGVMWRAARHLGISIQTYRRYTRKLIAKGFPIGDHVQRYRFDAEMRKAAENNQRARERMSSKVGSR